MNHPMLRDVASDGESDAGALAADIGNQSIERKHHFGEHYERTRESYALDRYLLQQSHCVTHAGKILDREFVYKLLHDNPYSVRLLRASMNTGRAKRQNFVRSSDGIADAHH